MSDSVTASWATQGPSVSTQSLEVRVAMLYERNYAPALAGIPFAFFLGWAILWDFGTQLPVWFLAAKTFTGLARMGAGHWFDLRRQTLSTRRWADLYVVLLVLDAGVWASMPILFAPADRPDMIAGTTALVVGIAGVGTSVLAPYWRAHIAFSSALILPSAAWNLAVQTHPFGILAGVSELLFYALIMVDGRRASQALRNQVEMKFQLDDALAVKSRFISTMSHELRTPLNAILGFGELLADDQALNEAQRENVSQIGFAGSHLLELINDILDISQIDSQGVRLRLERVDLIKLTGACVAQLRATAERRKISVNLELTPDVPTAQADPLRARQAIMNVLANAIKYNRPNGRIDIRLGLSETGMVRISVSDTGLGISAEDMKDLFQPFHRLGVEHIAGTGIGLAISKALLEQMKGRMGASSTPGQGSLFWLEFPRADESATLSDVEGTQGVVTTAPTATVAEAQAMTLLCVDDSETNLTLIRKMLQKKGHIRFVGVSDPKLALEAALECQPDLTLLDIQMPDLSGYEVLRILPSADGLSSTPIIAFTADALADDLERMKQAGFSDYLVKPVSMAALYAKIEEHRRPSDSFSDI